MVQDVRSSATDVVFDLLTQDGVVRALAFVRSSNATPERKRALRDLIFSYTNAGGDPALRGQIETELAVLEPTVQSNVSFVAASEPITNPPATVESVDISPAHPPATVSPAVASPERSGFGGGRLAPTFSTPVISPSIPVKSVPVPVVDSPVTISAAPLEKTVPVTSVDSVSAVMPPPTLDPEPVPMVAKSLVDEKLAPIAPQSEPTVEYVPPYREDHSLDTHRARIAEIKHMVNTKVGNPVNLVDMDNTIGRAYMTALLEAMKAVSGGGGDVTTLMAQLETVVVDVEKLFKAQAVPEPVSVPTAVPVSIPVPVVPPTVSADPISPVVQVPIEPMITTVQSNQVPVTNEDVVSITPMAIASSRFKNVLPMTEQEPLKTPADLPTAADLKARSGITDPLLDPDVDLGLDQLLGEWSLFRKSGVFGTGPKGRQHPLFLKLAELPMPLILSGRFEGSTNEIRQSITDYMNGWRYEQGVIYEQEESFEHYLRRVIRHIIDSQTRRRGA